MITMKQIKIIRKLIVLSDLMDWEAISDPFDVIIDGRKPGWGVADGADVRERIQKIIAAHPEVDIFIVSLEGVGRLDASFPREAFGRLIYEYLGKKGFLITDIISENQIDNIEAGANRLEIPIHIFYENKYRVLGNLEPKRTHRNFYELVHTNGWLSVSELSEKLDVKVNNASNKLKSLVSEGFLLRKEHVAPSGGVEFFYYPISL